MATDGNKTYGGNHFVMYINVYKSLCCTPETMIMLYVNCTSKKKYKLKKNTHIK